MASKPTIHTPKFYVDLSRRPRRGLKDHSNSTSPPSSSTTDMRLTPYQKRLGDAHFNLMLMEEVPSRSPSPEAQERIKVLKEKAEEAYEYAGGDPANGKWVHLSELLRPTSTRPRYWRWGKDPIINKESEGGVSSDYFLSESLVSKVVQASIDLDIAKKIELWQANIDPNPPSEDTQQDAAPFSLSPSKHPADHPPKPMVKARTNGRDNTPSLGFHVVKQSSWSSVGGKKPNREGTSKFRPAIPKNPPPSTQSAPAACSPEPKITDLSEGPLPPPSSPLGLPTSTPLVRSARDLRDQDQLSSPPPPPLDSDPHAIVPSRSPRQSYRSPPPRKRTKLLTPPPDQSNSNSIPGLHQSSGGVNALNPLSPPPTFLLSSQQGGDPQAATTSHGKAQSPREEQLQKFGAPGLGRPNPPSTPTKSGDKTRDDTDTPSPSRSPTKVIDLAAQLKSPRKSLSMKNSVLPFGKLTSTPIASRSRRPEPTFLIPPVDQLSSPFADEQAPGFATSTQRHTDGHRAVPPGLERGSSDNFVGGYDSQLDVNARIDRIDEFLQRDNDLFCAWINPDAMEDGNDEHVPSSL